MGDKLSPRGASKNEKMRADALEKISKAALDVFSEYGYQGATMKQITFASGLSYGLIYHYFPSKEQIFRHLVDFALESTIAGMHAFLDGPGAAWEKIERYSGILIQTALTGTSSQYFLIMLQAMTQGKAIPGLLDHIQKRSEVYFEIMAPVIAEAQKTGEAGQGDPLVLATAFFSLLQGLSLFMFQRKGFEKTITPSILMSVLRNAQAKSR
jgi:AcrR family transcriptional regulator